MMKILLSSFLVLFTSGALLSQDFEEGTHYDIVAEQASEDPKITEYFSLFCGHCFQFEPVIKLLQDSYKEQLKIQKSHVDYMPRDNEEVSFGIVKAFVTMKALGKQEQLTETFFAAIHLAEADLKTEEDIRKIFLQSGVTANEFDVVYNSSEVVEEASIMRKDWQKKGINNVPTLIINDKYKINIGSLGGMEDLKALISYLLDKK